jgi:hypothetical protein
MKRYNTKIRILGWGAYKKEQFCERRTLQEAYSGKRNCFAFSCIMGSSQSVTMEIEATMLELDRMQQQADEEVEKMRQQADEKVERLGQRRMK